jgi:hypothetical protein
VGLFPGVSIYYSSNAFWAQAQRQKLRARPETPFGKDSTMQNRTIEIKLRLNRKEVDSLNRRVKKSGLAREAYLRQLINGLPLNSDGIQLLQILTLPNWNERVLDALFESDTRPKGYGFMEYDAVINGRYVLSHLDSDFGRLIRFREGVRYETETQTGRQFGVVCYPWQVEFLRAYLEGCAALRVIQMEALWDALQ